MFSNVEPLTGSLQGGNLLTIDGNGFREETVIYIGGMECPRESYDVQRLTCRTPSSVAGTFDITIPGDRRDYEGSAQFTYSADQTPLVTAIQPVSGPAGSDVTIAGEGFTRGSTVRIGSADCAVDDSSLTDTSIVCTASSHRAGTHPVNVNVAGKGNAISEVRFEYSFSVRNVMPAEGKYI